MTERTTPPFRADHVGSFLRPKVLLDALAEHGVACLSDCLRGECGLCCVDVVELQGTIDHRDVFMTREEQQRNTRLCACVSRVTGGGVVIDSAWRPDTLGPVGANRP